MAMTNVERDLLIGSTHCERLAVRLGEATYLSGISRSGLYRMAAAGQILLLKHGASTLVDVASLRAAVASLPRARIKSA
jgi:hypothetical protein